MVEKKRAYKPTYKINTISPLPFTFFPLPFTLKKMAKLEELTSGSNIKGILPNQNVTVIETKWYSSDAIELIYKDAKGQPDTILLYRDDEDTLEIVTSTRPWSFNGDGEKLRLVSEAHRINLAYLFDPLLAVHTSLVEPLPHQITAVYGEMLNRQPLRFLLADDPGDLVAGAYYPKVFFIHNRYFLVDEKVA